MKKNLTIKLSGAKMALIGLGGIIINEIIGLRTGEIITTYQTNNLPKGYIQKGVGHVLGNRSMVNEGRKRINESRLKSKYLNQTIRGITE